MIEWFHCCIVSLLHCSIVPLLYCFIVALLRVAERGRGRDTCPAGDIDGNQEIKELG